MGHGGSEVHNLLPAEVSHGMDYYGFASFLLVFSFDSSLAYFANRRLAEISLSSIDTFRCLLPFGFGESRVHALLEASVPLRKQDASLVLGKGKVFFARDIGCSDAFADWYCMAEALAHMLCSHRNDPEAFDIPSSMPAVIKARTTLIYRKGD